MAEKNFINAEDKNIRKTEEIKPNRMIVNNAVFMIWCGNLLIVASFVVYALGITKTLISGTICGCFIDVFSLVLLCLFNKPSKIYNYDEQKILELIKEIKDENLKNKMIAKIVSKVR